MEKAIHQLKEIFFAGLDRANPCQMMTESLRSEGNMLDISGHSGDQASVRVSLSDFEQICVIGTGKATARMAKAVEDILGNRITEGVISVKYGHIEDLHRIRLIEAGHPVPDDNSVRAAREITALARKADEKTLIINLISGGGSALMPHPFEHKGIALSLRDKQNTTQVLLECGATINEINCVRKHLSGIKGGRLARMMYPARSLNFILSDVVGDSLDAIASGPTAPDATTFGDMDGIIRKYDIAHKLPEQVRAILQMGLKGAVPDTPKPDDRAFERVHNTLIGTNYLSLLAARKKAEALGFNTVILSSQLIGEAREVAKVLCGIGKDAAKYGLAGKKPCCIIAGGETTVTLRGKGKGGRNQEMALAFLGEMEKDPEGTRNICFLSAATDGNDGPTDAAGAFASRDILCAAQDKKLSVTDYLKNNDAYHFFDELGCLFKTGPTNTNVCDIQIMLVY